MARRYTFAPEPMSKLAIWARRMAVFSLCAVVVSIIIVRSEWLDIKPAITTFVVALVPSVFAFLLAFAAFAGVAVKQVGRCVLGPDGLSAAVQLQALEPTSPFRALRGERNALRVVGADGRGWLSPHRPSPKISTAVFLQICSVNLD